MTRTFEDFDASTVKRANPLIVGVTGPSFSGKTFSALRLATGIQRVIGGEIYVIDAEADRALHYKSHFRFRHISFQPPHSPEAYQEAIEYAVGRGAKIIVIDSMTHEHSGEGGVLDQIETFMNERYERAIAKGMEDWQAEKEADKSKWTAQIKPKGQRKRLNRKILSYGASVVFILCYRAEDKTKPVEGGKPVHLGWQAETTSKLPYDMTIRFLLPPASDGRPNLTPDTEFEKLSIKLPEDFRGWFKPGLQLNEDLGEKLARWSVGDQGAAPSDLELKIRSRVKALKWGGAEAVAFLRANYSKETIASLTAEEQADALSKLEKMS